MDKSLPKYTLVDDPDSLTEKVCGIYLLINNGEIFSIGKSEDISFEIFKLREKGSLVFDKFGYIKAEKESLDEVERQCIFEYKSIFQCPEKLKNPDQLLRFFSDDFAKEFASLGRKTAFEILTGKNAKAIDLINAAPTDPDKAAEALLLVAEYLRKGRKLPTPLANYLADAIETAMINPISVSPNDTKNDRGRALAVSLNLKANNKRPSPVTDRQVHAFMWWLINIYEWKQTKAAKAASREFGIDKSTAKRKFKKIHDTQTKHEQENNWKTALLLVYLDGHISADEYIQNLSGS